MAVSPALKRLRRLARRARRRLRRLVTQTGRTLPGRTLAAPPPAPAPAVPKRKPPARNPPQLSVVLSVHNDANYLDECLNSLLGATLRRLQVIAVDNGSTDDSAAILERRALVDRRLTVIRTERQSVGAARNLGASKARGTFLCFATGQDTVPRYAYRTLVRSLLRTGSDLAIGAVQRVKNGNSAQPPWSRAVHEFDRPATTISETPAAMQDLLAFNRVYRRTFWTKVVGGFRTDSDYGDVLSTITAYLRASSFDLLRSVAYQWHVRSDHASIVQERYDHAMLTERLPIVEAAWDLVSSEAPEAVSAAWLGGMLDTDLGAYLEQANTGDDAYRDILQRTARHFLDLATPNAWQYVRVDRRLRLWLAVQGNWQTLEQCVEYFRLHGTIPPTKVVAGRVVADLPFRDALGDDIPAVCLELSASQNALTSCVQKAFWDESGRLVVQGWSFFRGIDLSDTTPVLTAELVEPISGKSRPLPLEQLELTAGSRWENQLNYNVDAAGFRLTIDVSDLPPADPAAGPLRWFLQLTNQTYDICRTDRVRSVVRSGVALRVRARDLTSVEDPLRYVPIVDLDLGEGFALQVRPDRIRATSLVSDDGGRVSGTLRIVNPVAVPVVGVRASRQQTRIEAPVEVQPDGSLTFQLNLPPVEEHPRRWSFRALGEDGRRYRVSWPDEATAGRRVAAADASAAWQRSPRGFTDLVSNAISLQASTLSVTADEVTVEVETFGVALDDLREARLCSPSTAVAVTEVSELGPDRYRLVFPSRTEIWGTPDLPLPAGTYTIGVESLGLTCGITDSFLEECPTFGVTATLGYTIARQAGRDRLTLALRAPLADPERGRSAQRRLASWYDSTEFQPRQAVLFQCYRGEFATDTQRALHEELYRRGSPLELLWAVTTLSVALPEGAKPLLIGSRSWYEAVGSARYLCQNIDYDRFFRARPYQRYLQTFHGYPWKSMGISLWRAQGKSESLIAIECERRNSAWNSIVVPAPFCEELYRREYRYPHEVLVTGYPRDDAIVTSDPAAVRSAVLARLGIPEDKTVVLYAPTWRDTVATGAWTAQLFDELDLNRLRTELGDDYTLLLRGHNYNLRAGTQTSASVLDVSSYPEINDLILAADVAILDYSSLRFDWMLAGKPVLFFVPDLANYLSARTVLFEYAPTAPGPLLTTTDEVVAALRDLDSITTEYAPDREVFNRDYQALHDGHATERVVDAFFGVDAGVAGPSRRVG